MASQLVKEVRSCGHADITWLATLQHGDSPENPYGHLEKKRLCEPCARRLVARRERGLVTFARVAPLPRVSEQVEGEQKLGDW